jgi:transposase
MSESEWTEILGWPGYRVYRSEINEDSKTVRLWVRRKRGHRKIVCSGCGQAVKEIAEVYEREVRDLPCFEYRTTVVIELYRIVYDKFHILQHANQAVAEVRRAEFFDKGGAARDLVREKRWLLLTSWLNLNRGKRQQLNELFALNRRILKAYLLKESLSHLWNYTYEDVALSAELDRSVALAAAEADGATGAHVTGSLAGHPELCRVKVPLGLIEAVNGNIKALLRRGRGYRDMNYLLLKAQRLAATKTEFLVLQKAA